MRRGIRTDRARAPVPEERVNVGVWIPEQTRQDVGLRPGVPRRVGMGPARLRVETDCPACSGVAAVVGEGVGIKSGNVHVLLAEHVLVVAELSCAPGPGIHMRFPGLATGRIGPLEKFVCQIGNQVVVEPEGRRVRDLAVGDAAELLVGMFSQYLLHHLVRPPVVHV